MINNHKISQAQITKIHVAANQLGLIWADDKLVKEGKARDPYREVLSGFKNEKGEPCSSSKELNYTQANLLLDLFRKAGWKETRRYKDGKYAQYAGRDAKFASVGQLELIDRAWYNSRNVKEKNDDAMNRYIKRIVGVDHISFVLKKDVQKIKKAIESIGANN